MENLNEKALAKALKDNKSYKGADPFFDAIKKDNLEVADVISTVLTEAFTSNKVPLMTKLLALRCFKDLFILGNMELIDMLDQEVQDTIISAAAYNPKFRSKGKNDKSTRGGNYFVETEERPKDNNTFQLGNSFVLLATEIVKFFAKWRPNDEENQSSRFFQAYEHLQTLGVPFNTNIYFTAEDESAFHKNHQNWMEKYEKKEKNVTQQSLKSAKKLSKKLSQPKKQEEKKQKKQNTLKLAQSQIQQAKQHLQNKNSEIAKLKQQQERAKTQYTTKLKQIQQENEQKMKEKEQTIQNLNKKIKQSEDRVKNVQQKLEQKNKIIKNLQQSQMQVGNQEDKKNYLKIQQLQKNKEELKSSLNNKIKEKQEIQKKYKSLQNQIQISKKQMNEKNKQVLSLNKEVKMRKSENENLKDEIQELKMNNKNLEDKDENIGNNDERYEKLEQKLKKLKKENNELQNELERQKNDGMKKLEEMRNKHDEVMKLYKKARVELEDKEKLEEQRLKQADRVLKCKKNDEKVLSIPQQEVFIANKQNNHNLQASSNNHNLQASSNNYNLQSSSNNYRRNSFSRIPSNSLHQTSSNSSNYRSNSISKTENIKQKSHHYQRKGGASLYRTQNAFLKKSTHRGAKNRKPPHSIFPFISQYFPHIDIKESQHFRICALSNRNRDIPFFFDSNIELYLQESDYNKFFLRFKNNAANPIKVMMESDSKGVKISSNSGIRNILPFSEEIFNLQAEVVNLNFRFPIFTCLCINSGMSTEYKVPIPLTLASFSSFDQTTQALVKWDHKAMNADLKRFRCEKFALNHTSKDLTTSIENLIFQAQPLGIEGVAIMKYPKIPQIKILLRINESQGYCQIETQFDPVSKMNEAFSKVILQALMFSLV